MRAFPPFLKDVRKILQIFPGISHKVMISKSFLINKLKARSHDLARNRELDQLILGF